MSLPIPWCVLNEFRGLTSRWQRHARVNVRQHDAASAVTALDSGWLVGLSLRCRWCSRRQIAGPPEVWKAWQLLWRLTANTDRGLGFMSQRGQHGMTAPRCHSRSAAGDKSWNRSQSTRRKLGLGGLIWLLTNLQYWWGSRWWYLRGDWGGLTILTMSSSWLVPHFCKSWNILTVIGCFSLKSGIKLFFYLMVCSKNFIQTFVLDSFFPKTFNDVQVFSTI